MPDVASRWPIDPCVTSFIAGESRPAAGGERLPVVCPTTEAVLGELVAADAGEVDMAVAAARRAFDRGPWPRLGIDARKDILYRIRDTLRAHADELAWLESRTVGLPITRTREQVERAARSFEVFAEVASTARGETWTGLPGYLTWVTREPRGVAALIAPWNAPLALASMRLATCIAFGNTCVLKPSEYTPVSIRRLVELLHAAGLPPGVVNLVNGRGDVTGAALVAHPGIDLVAFTGGTRTGATIMAAAGARLVPCTLELGGKSASLVHPSADLDLALDGALAGIYSNNGQQCLAGSRIFLPRSLADDFMARFVDRARRIRIGDPLDPATELGPLAHAGHLRHVLGYVDVARAEGATLLTGGRRPPAQPRGWFIEPTAVLARDHGGRLCQEEIFGPFASFVVYDDFDEALALANATPFGLVAYVWSTDLDAAMRASHGLRAGTVWVNTTMVRELRAPFGGWGQSGVGADGATASLEFFTAQKTTTVPLGRAPVPRLGA